MKYILFILLLSSLCCITYFIGRFFSWIAFKINPSSFRKPFTDSDVNKANNIMLLGLLLLTTFIILILP